MASDGAGSARQLSKITFDYVPREDRLLARVQAADGERSALWLTRRLALRLVQALCAHLEKIASTQSPQHADLLQSFRHQAAVASNRPGAPVPDIDSNDAFLLDTIELQLDTEHAHLTLMLATAPSRLSLSQEQVWRLLQILLDMFRRAEWPVDAWPAWMRDPQGVHAGIDTAMVAH